MNINAAMQPETLTRHEHRITKPPETLRKHEHQRHDATRDAHAT